MPRKPDFLHELVLAIGDGHPLTAERALEIELAMRARWGGRRVFIGMRSDRRAGREPLPAEVVAKVRADLAAGYDQTMTARRRRVGRTAVSRIAREMRQEAAAAARMVVPRAVTVEPDRRATCSGSQIPRPSLCGRSP
ncbi:MAG: hypothetical protein JWQ11_3489 [Rhizobacter sp.]|nr:hypothetical protein [Rhizobacter sp.]